MQDKLKAGLQQQINPLSPVAFYKVSVPRLWVQDTAYPYCALHMKVSYN